jgi:hypothetical protein
MGNTQFLTWSEIVIISIGVIVSVQGGFMLSAAQSEYVHITHGPVNKTEAIEDDPAAILNLSDLSPTGREVFLRTLQNYSNSETERGKITLSSNQPPDFEYPGDHTEYYLIQHEEVYYGFITTRNSQTGLGGLAVVIAGVVISCFGIYRRIKRTSPDRP